jgi:prepilin peptidase CpaA
VGPLCQYQGKGVFFLFSIDYVLIAVLLISIFTDLQSQKIYNAVLFPAILFAFSYHLVIGGGQEVLLSIKGAGLGLLLFLIPYLLGGIGAGDVKLLAVVGAYKGTVFVLYSFFLTAILGGLIALFILLYRRELIKTIQSLLSRLIVWKLPSLDDEDKVCFPYGVAIALGSMLCYVVI